LTTILLGFAFINVISFEPVSIGSVLATSLTKLSMGGGPSHLIAIVLLPSWLGAVIAFSADEAWPVGGNGLPGTLLTGALASGLVGALFALAKAAQASAASKILGAVPPGAASSALEWHFNAMPLLLLTAVLMLVLFWGLCFCAAETPAPGRITPRERWTALATMAAASAIAWPACVNPVRADAMAGLANAMNRAARVTVAIDAYRRALDFDSNSSAYRFELAQLLAAMAEASGKREDFESYMREAESLEKDGRKISTLDQQGALMLGDIYAWWAAGQDDPERRLALARNARRSLDEAQAFKPVAEYALVDLAAVDSITLGDPKGAAEALGRADAILQDHDLDSWFDAYAGMSSQARNSAFGRFYARRAFGLCAIAVEAAEKRHQPTFSLRLRGGILHYRLGELRAAQSDLQAAAREDHDADEWKAEGLLAATFSGLGDPQSALGHMKKAVELAPEQPRAALQAALAQMNAQLSPQSK
jgi:hypothetical protein